MVSMWVSYHAFHHFMSLFTTALQIIRKTIGYENSMMVDANQRWDVNEAIENMIQVGVGRQTRGNM